MSVKLVKLLALLGALVLLAAACNGGDTDDAAPGDDPAATETAATEPVGEGDGEGEATETETEEAATADDFPSGPITLIVVFGPGGANDLLARMLAPKLSEVLGVQVAVENIEGGSGVVGLTEAYQREADGHTLVTYSPPGEYLSQIQDQLSGFTVDDFTMLGAVNVDPGAIAVPIDSPFESLADLNEAARQEQLTAATSGLTSNNAVGGFNYMAATGVDFSLVPYDSGSELTAALIGGTTDLGIRAGGWYDLHGEELRILAFTYPQRVDEFPDIPTVAEETGEEVVFSSMRGLAVRSETPQERIDVLADAFEQVANDPEIRDNLLEEIGFRWEYLTMEEAAQQTEQMQADVDAVADQIGIGQ